ncbi:MAG: trypsin-like peptidase domain-containing protein [Peptococcaceae bacterium]|jgi:serine protease Do|nr:trypsin-like peptidase domain-containing protein [Peptococcaceae bacterium]
MSENYNPDKGLNYGTEMNPVNPEGTAPAEHQAAADQKLAGRSVFGQEGAVVPGETAPQGILGQTALGEAVLTRETSAVSQEIIPREITEAPRTAAVPAASEAAERQAQTQQVFGQAAPAASEAQAQQVFEQTMPAVSEAQAQQAGPAASEAPAQQVFEQAAQAVSEAVTQQVFGQGAPAVSEAQTQQVFEQMTPVVSEAQTQQTEQAAPVVSEASEQPMAEQAAAAAAAENAADTAPAETAKTAAAARELTAEERPAGVHVVPQAASARESAGRPPKSGRGKMYVIGAVACLCTALLGGAVGGLIGYRAAAEQIQKNEPYAETSTVPSNSLEANKHYNLEDASRLASTSEKQALSVMEIDRNVGQTVVGITTEVTAQSFFGVEQTQKGSGSGIIITADGFILTNNHVIDGANAVKVHLKSGEEYPATLAGYDPKTDLAVIKINAQGLPVAILGDSSTLQVGEMAVAIGNPLGELQGTVTVGIISALNRSMVIEGKTMNLLQTDAAINFGNSGGALVNSFGEVIGINTAKTSAVGVEGLGFAIPVNDAKPIIDELISRGYVSRPKIGIGTRDVTQQLAERNNLPVGIYVMEVEEFSAAEKAGIKIGDVVIEIDGEPVKTTEELNQQKNRRQVGDVIKLTLVRDGFRKEVDLTLMEEKPEDFAQQG